MKSFMRVENGLPKDDDRALFLDVKLSDDSELSKFEEDGGLKNAKFFDGKFYGQAYDDDGFVCLGLPLESVTKWRYALYTGH